MRPDYTDMIEATRNAVAAFVRDNASEIATGYALGMKAKNRAGEFVSLADAMVEDFLEKRKAQMIW